MDEMLKPVTTTVRPKTKAASTSINGDEVKFQIATVDEAIKTLQGSPSALSLEATISFLHKHADATQDAKISQAASVLINTVIPDWWQTLQDDRRLADLRGLVLECLCRVTFLALLVSRIKLLASTSRAASTGDVELTRPTLEVLLDILEAVIREETTISRIYTRCSLASPVSRTKVLWKEAVSMLSTGRLISTVAEAEDVLRTRALSGRPSWIGQGTIYARWLASNISAALLHGEDGNAVENKSSALATLFSKALMIGYSGTRISQMLSSTANEVR